MDSNGSEIIRIRNTNWSLQGTTITSSLHAHVARVLLILQWALPHYLACKDAAFTNPTTHHLNIHFPQL